MLNSASKNDKNVNHFKAGEEMRLNICISSKKKFWVFFRGKMQKGHCIS